LRWTGRRIRRAGVNVGAGNYYGLDGLLGKGLGGGIRRWLMSGDPDGGAAA
jgi:hypothetical protein